MNVVEELRAMPELDEAPSRFNRAVTAFLLGSREIVHLHGDEVEIRLTRREIAKLDDERVWQRARTSDWIGTRDGALALQLVRRAIEANGR
jgi:hypothetical protein